MTLNQQGIEQSAVGAEHLGALLRYHRERAGLSRRALSELSGASETAIYDVEGGKVTARLSTLLTIAGALSVTLSAHGPLSADFLEQLRPDERFGTDADE